MILVVGATGVLGRQALQRLLAKGCAVRALLRSRAQVRELAAQGVDVAVGDLVDGGSLARACVGADRVFAAAHSALGRGRYRSERVDDAGHRALIDASRAAGVRRFIYTSAFGAAPDHPVDFYRTKYAIEEYLRASEIDHVILRPTAFMEWHAHLFIGKPILDKGRTLILGSGRKPRNFVAGRDVARVAVDALTGSVRLPAVVAIGGPGNYTNDEVADMYARCAGIEARARHVPVSLLRLLAPAARLAHAGVGRVLTMAALPDDAYPETYGPVAGAGQIVGSTSLEDFIRECVAQSRLKDGGRSIPRA